MKDSEFIELLNLYLDHELSVADAARLEAEVQSNASRRKVYQQYCRMQKACKVLAADFESGVARDTAAAEQKIIAFNPTVAAAAVQRRRTSTMVTFGSLAAAACLAVILVNRRDGSAVNSPAAQPGVITQSPAAPTQSAHETRVAVAASAGPRMLGNAQPRLVTDPLLLTQGNSAEAVTVAANDTDEPLKWIPNLQIAPLQQRVPAEDLRFDVRPATLRPDARGLTNNRAPTETKVEMTAFRFQR
jgi:hypothetical protein